MAVGGGWRGGKDEDEYRRRRRLSGRAACGSAHKPAGLSIIGDRWLPKGPPNLPGSLGGGGGEPLFNPLEEEQSARDHFPSLLTPKIPTAGNGGLPRGGAGFNDRCLFRLVNVGRRFSSSVHVSSLRPPARSHLW